MLEPLAPVGRHRRASGSSAARRAAPRRRRRASTSPAAPPTGTAADTDEQREEERLPHAPGPSAGAGARGQSSGRCARAPAPGPTGAAVRSASGARRSAWRDAARDPRAPGPARRSPASVIGTARSHTAAASRRVPGVARLGQQRPVQVDPHAGGRLVDGGAVEGDVEVPGVLVGHRRVAERAQRRVGAPPVFRSHEQVEVAERAAAPDPDRSVSASTGPFSTMTSMPSAAQWRSTRASSRVITRCRARLVARASASRRRIVGAAPRPSRARVAAYATAGSTSSASARASSASQSTIGRRRRRPAGGDRARRGRRAASRRRTGSEPAGVTAPPRGQGGAGATHRGGHHGHAGHLGAGQRVLAGRRGRTVQVAVLDQRLARTARAEGRGRAAGARVQVAHPDRRAPAHVARVAPDLGERRLADVAADDRQRHARRDVAVGAHVAGVVAGPAQRLVEIGHGPRASVVGSGSGCSVRVAEHALQVGAADAQQDGRACRRRCAR